VNTYVVSVPITKWPLSNVARLRTLNLNKIIISQFVADLFM
jgi:hypothetical protein